LTLRGQKPEDLEAIEFAKFFTIGSILQDLLLIVVALCIVIGVVLIRGGHGLESLVGIDTCSATSWLALVLAHVGCGVCSMLAFNKHRARIFGKVDPEYLSMLLSSRHGFVQDL